MKFDTTILGGFPVTIQFNVLGKGFTVDDSPVLDSWDIIAINGKPCKTSPKWLYERIEKTKGEQNRIDEDCWDYLENIPHPDE